MSDIIAIILSCLMIAGAALVRPTSARCPKGYYLATGVRENGAFACWTPIPPEDENLPVPDRYAVRSRIYCPAGQRAFAPSTETVRCMVSR